MVKCIKSHSRSAQGIQLLELKIALNPKSHIQSPPSLVSIRPQLICPRKEIYSYDALKDAISHLKLQIIQQNYRKLN